MLVLTGCTSSDGGSPKKPEALKRDATVVKPAWTADVDPLGQPVVLGDAKTGFTVVVIAKEPAARLKIVGIDGESGKQLWSHPLGPNHAVPGIALIPHTTETAAGEKRVIFYLAPNKPGKEEADLTTPLVAVEPRTGKIELKSPKVYAAEAPDSCEDDTDVCMRGALEGERDYANLRVDLESGKISRVKEGAPDDARLIGADGLFSTGDRPAEKLGVYRDGKTLWSTSVDTLFGPGRTSDGGWAFTHEAGPDRYIGYLGQRNGGVKGTADSPYVYDLGKQTLTSFSGADGSILWQKKGADQCFRPTDFDDEEKVDAIKHPVRCQMSGTFTVIDDKRTVQNVAMTIEGYDPVSGTTSWTHKMPAEAAAAYQMSEPRVLMRGGRTIVATLAGGPALIDVATGKFVKAKGQTFMCQTDAVEHEYVTPWIFKGRSEHTRRGTGLAFPCSADGKAVKSGMTVAALTEGAVKIDDSTYVVSSDAGLVGYDIGKR
ncbi:hypothetical protein GCM10022234_30720 [Aeromicrobium panaciterrae]